MGHCTVENFLAVPFDKWSPQSLLERADDESIPFETDTDRDLIGISLCESEQDLQAVFDEAIKPLIELQKKYRQELEENKISGTTLLYQVSQEECTKIMEDTAKYKEKLGDCSWVLPAEGFGTEAILKEAGLEMPKCMGMLEVMMKQAMQQEQSSSQ